MTTTLTMCPDCRVAHVHMRCPRAPKLCVNGRKAHADGDHHYVTPPSEVICAECMDRIGATLDGTIARLQTREEQA